MVKHVVVHVVFPVYLEYVTGLLLHGYLRVRREIELVSEALQYLLNGLRLLVENGRGDYISPSERLHKWGPFSFQNH
jgi:hypothetical protein